MARHKVPKAEFGVPQSPPRVLAEKARHHLLRHRNFSAAITDGQFLQKSWFGKMWYNVSFAFWNLNGNAEEWHGASGDGEKAKGVKNVPGSMEKMRAEGNLVDGTAALSAMSHRG